VTEKRGLVEDRTTDSFLFVSNDLSAINDTHNNRFICLGGVEFESFDKMDDVDHPLPGCWEIDIINLEPEDLFNYVNVHCAGSHNQIFRISSKNGMISREGQLAEIGIGPDFEICVGLTIDTTADPPVKHGHPANTENRYGHSDRIANKKTWFSPNAE